MNFFIGLIIFEVVVIYYIRDKDNIKDETKMAIWAGLVGLLYFGIYFYLYIISSKL